MDQRYPQTPHSHATPTHVSLPHTLLKLFISVNDFPSKDYYNFKSSEAKQVNVAQTFIEHLCVSKPMSAIKKGMEAVMGLALITI